jgi:hypothetical protein
MSVDQPNVYTTASANLSYLCQGDVTATVTSPDGSNTASGDVGLQSGGSTLSITQGLAIGYEDGTYSGSGIYYYDGSDSGYGAGYFPQQNRTTTVTPFVILTAVAFDNMAKINTSGGTIHFTAGVNTSTGCSGTVAVEADLTTPSGAVIGWTMPSTGNSITISESMSSGSQFNFTFTAQTDPMNSVNGASHAIGSVTAYPSGCNLVGTNNQIANFTISPP